MTHSVKAIAFDAYGTLFDVYAVGATAEKLFPGKGSALAMLWRDKQVEYTRLRTMCGQHADFRRVTEDALAFCCQALELPIDASGMALLMSQYDELTAFGENSAVLTALQNRGIPMAILSNGTPAMLDSATQAAGLNGFFNHMLSVEAVGKFKTAPEAYQMGPDAFGIPAQEILFVSSNCWDICGATWFGYTTLWLNRSGQPMEHLGVSPNATGKTLDDVLSFVEASDRD